MVTSDQSKSVRHGYIKPYGTPEQHHHIHRVI
jgi:hypothetical protein